MLAGFQIGNMMTLQSPLKLKITIKFYLIKANGVIFLVNIDGDDVA